MYEMFQKFKNKLLFGFNTNPNDKINVFKELKKQYPSQKIKDSIKNYDKNDLHEKIDIHMDILKEILQINENEDFLNELIIMFLLQEDQEFINLQKKIDNLPYVHIKGEIQIGKTKYLVMSAIYSVFILKTLPIIILDDTNTHLNDFLIKLTPYLNKLKDKLNLNLNIINYNNLDDINDQSIIVAINHHTGLKKILNYIKDNNLKYNLFIDEADKTKYGGKTGTIEDVSLARKNIKILKENAEKNIDCTATSFALYENENMTPENIFTVKRSLIYKGVDYVTWKSIPSKLTIKENKKHMFSWVRKISYHKGFMTDERHHPAIGLFVFDRRTKEHKNFVKTCMKKYKNCDYLEFNGSQKKTNTYRYNGKKIHKNHYDIIQEQKRNLIIVAGDFAGRGISYVSTDYKKHLTHEYIYPSKTASTTKTTQNLRILGKYPDEIPLIVISSENDMNDILKSQGLNNELATHCNTETTIKNQIKNIGINKEKLPKRKITNSSKKTIKKINGYDGRIKIDSFYEENNVNLYIPGNDSSIVIVFFDNLTNNTQQEYFKYIKKFLENKKNRFYSRKIITSYILKKIDTEESTVRAQLTFLQKKGIPYDNKTDGLVFRQKGGKHSEIEISLVEH